MFDGAYCWFPKTEVTKERSLAHPPHALSVKDRCGDRRQQHPGPPQDCPNFAMKALNGVVAPCQTPWVEGPLLCVAAGIV